MPGVTNISFPWERGELARLERDRYELELRRQIEMQEAFRRSYYVEPDELEAYTPIRPITLDEISRMDFAYRSPIRKKPSLNERIARERKRIREIEGNLARAKERLFDLQKKQDEE